MFIIVTMSHRHMQVQLNYGYILVNSTATGISATPVNSYVMFYPFRSSLNSNFSYLLILLTSDCNFFYFLWKAISVII